MSPEEQMIWENEQLDCEVDFSRLKVFTTLLHKHFFHLAHFFILLIFSSCSFLTLIFFPFLQIDPAPFQLVEQTSLIKVHSLFSMLQLNHTYVTSIGKLVGVVSIKDVSRKPSPESELFVLQLSDNCEYLSFYRRFEWHLKKFMPVNFSP